MAKILVPSRRVWTRQPKSPTRICQDGPVTPPVASAVATPGGAFCVASKGYIESSATLGSGLKISAGQAGFGVDGLIATTSPCRLNSVGRTIDGALNNVWDSPTSAVTFMAVCERLGTNSAGTSQIFMNGSASAAPYNAYAISLSSSNVLNISCSAGGSYREINLSTLPQNSLSVIVGRYNGSKLEAFLNGAKFGTSIACSGALGYPGTGAYPGGPSIGNYYDFTASSRSFAGRVYAVALWPNALSDAEIIRLSANPWQLFQPRERQTFYSIGAGESLAASASGSDTASGSATLAAQVALAGVGVSVSGGSAQGSVGVPLSAAGISVSGGSANGVATVSISAAGLARAAGQAGLSAAVLLQAAGAAQAAGNTALAAQLTAMASGAGQAGGSANLTGGAPGALSASGGDVASGSAVLSVSVKLQATGAAQAGGSASGSASAPGALSASGQGNASGFASWSALVTLTAAGFVQVMGAGSLQVSIPLAAAGTAQASGVAQATLGGLVNRFALQAREKRLTETAASVWRVALIETGVERLTRLVHEVKHV